LISHSFFFCFLVAGVKGRSGFDEDPSLVLGELVQDVPTDCTPLLEIATECLLEFRASQLGAEEPALNKGDALTTGLEEKKW
jgi:hypothetical protein